MVRSISGQFEMTLYHAKQGYDFKEIQCPEGNLVIVERDQPFYVQITNLDPKDHKTYGAKLTIDGYTLPYKKTWRRSGKFFGFKEKQGMGNYQYFQFSLPEVAEQKQQYSIMSEQAQFLQTKQIYQGENLQDLGKITVTIYDIIPAQKERKYPKLQKLKTEDQYTPSQRPQDEKMYVNSLTVSKGEKFQNPIPFQKIKQQQISEKFYPIINEEQVITTLTVKYIDFYTAIIKGYLSEKNINHLKFFPDEYIFKCEPVLIRCLACILLAYNCYMEVEFLEQKFEQYLKREFKDMEVGDLQEFLDKYPQEFIKNQEQEYFVNIQSINFNSSHIPREYYRIEKDQENHAIDSNWIDKSILRKNNLRIIDNKLAKIINLDD